MNLFIKAYNKNVFLNFYKKINNQNENTKRENDVIFDIINWKNYQITFYKNNSIYIKEIFETTDNKFLNEELKNIIQTTLVDKNMYIGFDEVGVGETIGPIVVCGFRFKDIDKKNEAILLNIKDSKKMTRFEINNVAKKIINLGEYYYILLTPKQFNDLKIKIDNVKAINAILQNEIQLKFKNLKNVRIVDMFVNESKYQEYLTKYSKNIYNGKLTFIEQAEEKYLEVACAAIIAKYHYNNWVLGELNKFNIKIDFDKKISQEKMKKYFDKNEILKETFYKKWK